MSFDNYLNGFLTNFGTFNGKYTTLAAPGVPERVFLVLT
jgi:hypothetical protein